MLWSFQRDRQPQYGTHPSQGHQDKRGTPQSAGPGRHEPTAYYRLFPIAHCAITVGVSHPTQMPLCGNWNGLYHHISQLQLTIGVPEAYSTQEEPMVAPPTFNSTTRRPDDMGHDQVRERPMTSEPTSLTWGKPKEESDPSSSIHSIRQKEFQPF